jgi:hypothetical protein
MSRIGLSFAAALVLGMSAPGTAQDRLQSSDLLKLRSVSAVQRSIEWYEKHFPRLRDQ